jgi:NADPH:quinone reductase-like Zn-dependent oxidoreductase
MKAAFVTRYGGPEVLEILETPRPDPLPLHILVRVEAIGLNFADIFGRFGVYPGTPEPPFIPGLELSGVVAGLGTGVTQFKEGDRVMGYSRLGSHAEFVVLDERLAMRIPEGMPFDEGASFLATNLSAYHGIVRLANTRPGERLLVHAAAGGVGIASVQIGLHLGCEVFATAGTDAKADVVRRQGAHHVVNYRSADFFREFMEITNSHGVDVVMDSVGGDVFRKSWDLLAQMGRYILYGISSVTGKGALSKLKVAKAFSLMRPIFPPSLPGTNKGIFGFNLGTLKGKEEYFKEAVTKIVELYHAGAVRPFVGSRYPFSKIVEAHRALQLRQTIGKVVVLMND